MLTFSLSLILVSTSSRINVGSVRPALAKSTKTFGSVAEKRTVCLQKQKKNYKWIFGATIQNPFNYVSDSVITWIQLCIW